MSTSTYKAQQELEKAFSEDRKEHFAPPQVEISHIRIKFCTEMQEKRQPSPPKKSTK